METIDELLVEAAAATDRFWFVRELQIIDRTDSTATVHFVIDSDLFVQIFLSQRTGRLSLALVGPSGRLYGRDREQGSWHRHPFGHSEIHEVTPEGMSSQPVMQFIAEVEDLLIAHALT